MQTKRIHERKIKKEKAIAHANTTTSWNAQIDSITKTSKAHMKDKGFVGFKIVSGFGVYLFLSSSLYRVFKKLFTNNISFMYVSSIPCKWYGAIRGFQVKCIQCEPSVCMRLVLFVLRWNWTSLLSLSSVESLKFVFFISFVFASLFHIVRRYCFVELFSFVAFTYVVEAI